MKELNNTDVKAYIRFESLNVSKRRILFSHIMINGLVSIPTALFGVYSNITKILIIPIIVLVAIWAVNLAFGIERKQKEFILFLGCNSLILSMTCLLAIYKILSTIIEVSTMAIIGVIVFYIIGLIINNLNVLRLIKKGYYHKNSNSGSAVLIFPFAIFGLGIGKAMIGNIGQNGAVILIAFCLMFFAVVCMVGTHNLLKYMLIQKFDKSID